MCIGRIKYIFIILGFNGVGKSYIVYRYFSINNIKLGGKKGSGRKLIVFYSFMWNLLKEK